MYSLTKQNETTNKTKQTHKNQASKQTTKKTTLPQKKLGCQWPCSQETKLRRPEYCDGDNSCSKSCI